MKFVKNLALILGSLAALGAIRSKAKQQQVDQQLWSQATDPVSPVTPTAPPAAGTTTLGNPPA